MNNVVIFVKEFFTMFYGVVSQIVGYLGANPTVLICIVEGLFLAIGGVWCFFIKGRKEGEKIDLENEKAKLELEKIQKLHALEVQQQQNLLNVTSSIEYQKAIAELDLENKKLEVEAKKLDLEAKKAEIDAKKAETARTKKETRKMEAEIKKIKAEIEDIRSRGNENNQSSGS